MNSRIKFVALAAAVVVLAGAVLLIPRGDETATPPSTAQAGSVTPPTGATEASEPTKPRIPKPPLLTAAKPKELEFTVGETIRFAVENDVADEVHVHGYDKTMELPANRRKTMRFKADIEGIFEIELENSGQPIGTLKVISK
ncbi:MAG: hypothetical protein ACPGYP_05980 [Solirubrobacterales bacterium]